MMPSLRVWSTSPVNVTRLEKLKYHCQNKYGKKL
jgi:hypothetical protein